MPFRFLSLRSTPRRAAVVSVDLSPGRFKLVALAAGADGPELLGVVDEPTEPATNGPFDPAGFALRLRRALKGLGVEPQQVALVLGPAEAVVRRLAVVPQAREATLAALSLQLAPALGPDVTGPRVDYVPLGAPASGGRVSVLAAAGRRDAIAAQSQAVVGAGFEVGAVVPAGAALACAWRSLGPEHGAERVLLLHVGESAVVWMVMERGEPVAVDAPLVGVSALRDRAGAEPSGDLVDSAPGAVEEWVARVRQEVHRGVQAARREAGNADPATGMDVWLCGGGARISGLAEALSVALGAPVHVFDPMRRLAAEEQVPAFGPALVPAIGAAMQMLLVDPAAPALNLRVDGPVGGSSISAIPLHVLVREIARDWGFRYAALAAVGGFLVTLALGARYDTEIHGLARREVQVVADSARVATSMAQGQALMARRREMGAAVEQLRVLDRNRDLWPRVLDRVARALPSTAWVSGLAEAQEDPASVRIAFRVRGYAPSEQVASAFLARIDEAGLAAGSGGAQTRLVNIGSVTAVEFEITAEAGIVSAEDTP